MTVSAMSGFAYTFTLINEQVASYTKTCGSRKNAENDMEATIVEGKYPIE